MLTIHRDITDIVLQEERLKAAQAVAEEAQTLLDDALGSMTSGVAIFATGSPTEKWEADAPVTSRCSIWSPGASRCSAGRAPP